MIIVSFLFATLLLATPPLILGVWVILFIRFGLLEFLLRQTKLLADSQQKPVLRDKTWMILAIGVFSVFTILFLCLDVMLLLAQRNEGLEAGILGEKSFSIFLTFLYSPVCLVLILEAWLMLLSYFGLHRLLYHRGIGQNQRIRSLVVTAMQLAGIITCLVGFGWWSYVGNTDQNRFESINNFSLVELSPTTVLLTVGLVVMLFISLSKISLIEKNTDQCEQVSGRMTVLLVSTLILLGLTGGILLPFIHQDRSLWNNL